MDKPPFQKLIGIYKRHCINADVCTALIRIPRMAC